MEFQSSQNKQNIKAFKKKLRVGQICPEWAEAAQIWPRSIRSTWEMDFEWANRWGLAISGSSGLKRYGAPRTV
jgi:hypothetical protein